MARIKVKRRIKKVAKKKNKKKTNKKKVHVDQDFDIEKLVSSLSKKFALEVMTEDSEDTIPYYINFKHKGLQTITGGVPGGRFTEIHGDSQSGKSFLLYELGLEAIEMGGAFMLHDVERAFQPSYGRRVGLTKGKKFVVSKVRELQEIFNLSKQFALAIRKVNKSCPILIGVDSYPPVTTLNSEKEEAEQLKAGGIRALKGYRAAKKNDLFNQLLGEFITFIEKENVTFVVLNQLKEKIGVLFGDPSTVNADNIIKFYATMRLRGKLGPKISNKDTKTQVGVITRWQTIKNRNIVPFKKVATEIYYKDGINPYSGLQDLLILEGAIKKGKNKSQFIYKKKKYKTKQFRAFMKKYPEVLEGLEL